MSLRRVGILAAGIVALLALGTTSQAQIWNNYTGGVWSVGTNWQGGVAPVSSNATILTFGSTPSNVPPIAAFQPTGNYTATLDAAAPFIVNQIILNGTNAADVSSNGIVISSNAAATAGGLSFQGTTPRITQNGTASVAFANGTATADLQLTADGLTIDGTGSGHLNLNGVITGGVGATNILTINHTGASPMASGSQIFLAPGAANTFLGNTVLQAGNLTLNTANSPLGAAANTLEIQGGTLRGSSAFTLANNVILTGQMRFVGIVAPTFTGVVSGNGGIFFNPGAAIQATFQNTISGNGAIIAEGSGSFAPNITLNSTASLNGTALNAVSYTFNNANFSLSNTTATAVRLNSAATLNLNNATFTLAAGTGGSIAESVAATNLSGGNVFTITPTATTGAVFNGGTLTRNNNGTMLVITQGTGFTLGNAAGPGVANLLFSNLSAGDNINGVLPFASALIGTGVTGQTNLVRYDATNGVTPLNLTSDYTLNTSDSSHPYIVAANPTGNYRIVSGTGNYGGSANNITANSLLWEVPTGVGTLGASIYGTGTLSLTSGVFATSIVGGTTAATFAGNVISKDIALGAQGNFHTQAPMVATGSISGTSGLVKSGVGALTLTGNNSGLTGGLTVNAGQLQFTNDANLGASGQGITLGFGPTVANLLFNPTNQFGPGNVGDVSINRPLTIAGTAGLLSVTSINSTLTWDGQISGNGRLIKSFLGTVALGNNSNNFVGDVGILQGTLRVSNDGQLGNAANNIVMNGTTTGTGAGILQFDSSFTTNRNILITTTTAGANFVYTNGASTVVTMNGHIGGAQTGVPFNKIGAGELILTANNTINGAYTQGDTAATRRAGASFAQPGGTVTLQGPNGALSAGTSYTLNLGSTLHLNNATDVNQSRLASKQVTLAGAELKLTGNATQDVYEHIGVSATLGLTNSTLGNTITLSQPASAMMDKVTTLVATSYQTSGSTGIAFFRGTNLGGATGDRTAMIFVASPTLTNNVLPQAFYADSPTASPQDFATVVSNSVQRFTGYVALPATGSVNTTTYEVTGGLVLGSGAAVNALKLNNANIDMVNNNIVNSTTGLLLSTGVDVIGASAAGTIDIAFANQAARISVSNSLDIGSVANPVRVTGSAGLHKFGPGVLSLSGSNITSGGYQVSGGTLRLLAPTAILGGTLVTTAPGATFDINGLGTTAAPVGSVGLAGYGTVAIGAGTLGTGAATGTFGGALTGTGNVVQTGTSIQTWNGNSPGFSGNLELRTGAWVVDANVVPSDVTNPGPFGTGTTPIQIGAAANAATLTLGINVNRFERDINVVPGTGTVIFNTSGAGITNITSNIGLGGRRFQFGPSIFATGPGSITLSGNISDGDAPGGIFEHFGGQIALWGNNTYTGGTRIQADGQALIGVGSDTAFGTGTVTFGQDFADTGTLRADNGARVLANNFAISNATADQVGVTGVNDLTINGTFNLAPLAGSVTRTFDISNTGTTTFAGDVVDTVGTASLVKRGGGLLVLSGNNDYTNGTTLNGGTLGLGSDSVGGPVTSGPVGIGTFTINAGAVRAVGGDRTVNNAVTVGGDFAVDGSNNLTLGGAMNIGTAVRRVVVTNSGLTTFAGVIGATAGGLTKDGPGVLNLTGDNLYSGNTTVVGGTLRVNNTTGSGTGTGTVTVRNTATLGGTGTISGATTHESGSTLSPGNSVGSLNFATSLNVDTGATYNWEINGYTPLNAGAVNTGLSTDGLNHDRALVAGVFTGGDFTLRINELGTPTFTVGEVYSWTIATGLGTPTIGSVTFDLTTAPTFVSFGGLSALSVTVALNQVNVNFTPVPEPATILGLSAGAFAVGGLIRRRFKKSTTAV